METIAHRTLSAVDPDGSTFDLTIRIGAPQPRGGEAACMVSVSRLFEEPRLIYGVDGWQALTLALRFIQQLLEGHLERGGRLHAHGTTDPVDLASLMARR